MVEYGIASLVGIWSARDTDVIQYFPRRFGRHIKELRGARQLSQEALAERSGLSTDGIRRIERGTLVPSLVTVCKICTGLSVSLRTLFDAYERDARDEVREISDYLATRSRRELNLAWRMIRALFEDS